MLDIQFIRDNQQLVATVCKNKNVDANIGQLLKLDQKRGQLQARLDELRYKRNQLSTQTKNQKPSEADLKTARKLKSQIGELEDEFTKINEVYQTLLAKVPNVYSKDTPVGKDAGANKVVRKWGAPAKFGFNPKPHWQLGAELGLIDMERAAKVSGARFSYLKGNLVKMQLALFNLALDTITDADTLKKIIKSAKLKVPPTPFTPMLVPAMVRKDVFSKTGRLEPIEDKYYLEDDELFLAGSAEHTLVTMHSGETFKNLDLPVRYAGYSTAFRREAGSYGQDVRGILRQHQFDKLELETFSTAEAGPQEQLLVVAIQEYLLQQLKLPYQVVLVSSGDMGKPDYRQIDIETWLPSQNKYRETHTADYVGDYQARRLQIKYEDEKGQKQLAHMNDATAFAMGRTLLAIMENYQTEASKIKVPQVLQKYMGGLKYL